MSNPFPFSSGAVLTAAQLNNIGSWVDFTPASGNWSSRSTVVLARYAQVNKLVVVKYKIELDASPTSGDGNFSIAQPVVEESGDSPTGTIGSGYLHDANTSYSYPVMAFISGTEFFLRYIPTGASDVTVDYNSPFTFADGDEIRFLAIYEAD